MRRAERLRKETGDDRYRTPFNKPDIRQLIWISVTRPLHLLFTEPIVMSFSVSLPVVFRLGFGRTWVLVTKG